MFDPSTIACQVLHNCDISDATHAGLYSICGLALRLRDLYKWENGLQPWEEKESAEVLEWIGAKEEAWEQLTEQDYDPISILGKTYDPFDTTGINAALGTHGLFYGAGYARSLKPTFFLALIEERRVIDRHPIYILGRELARDLLTLPALSQNNGILLRREAARLFIWDKLFYLKKSGRRALQFALAHCGIHDCETSTLRQHLNAIVQVQQNTYIFHEVGEMRDTVFDRSLWREIIGTFPHTPVEMLVRAVKDLLADTNEFGSLRSIIRERRAAALGLYVAFVDGLPKELFPEITASFGEFMRTGDWQIVERAVEAGYQTAKHHAEVILDIFRTGKLKGDDAWIEREIGSQLLEKLIR
jgi:hypothetical protein